MTNIHVIQEVLGDYEDFRTGIGNMIRIGRPVLQECQDKAVDTLGGAAIVLAVVLDDKISRNIRFPTSLWYVRPAKAQTSLRIRAV